MLRKDLLPAVLIACALAVSTAFAQQATGSIQGRIVDDADAAVPGATVTATNSQTGFVRSETTDGVGLYRLTGLPVGTYDVSVELQGFSRVERKAIAVNVAQTLDLQFKLSVGQINETVTVTGEAPLIETASSSVGAIVDVKRLESLPLNGRQFANLAVTVAGVDLGFHTDPTKSQQYSPQIGGGNGRNVNYQIDGGDNNDDTVGGLLQLFPLEAIEQYSFQTQRYKAEYGRSNGGVMNIVTKSGANQVRGSGFTMLRNRTLNSQTESERRSNVDKQYYRRYQYGGSFGGPIARDKAHFFGAAERTQQDTKQAVNLQGLFPELDGVYDTPYRENLATGKVTTNVSRDQLLAVRIGWNSNSQPFSASALSPPNGWATSENEFKSFNVNHNWVLGGSKVNAFIFQYADFTNAIVPNSLLPRESFPSGVAVGQAGAAPQATEQKKWQFRDDFTWSQGGHGLKAGVNFIYEPRLYLTFNTGRGDYAYQHLDNRRDGPILEVSRNDGDAYSDTPMKQYGFYFQDDWRVTDRLTLNLGLRYDLAMGFAIDQSKNDNFVKLQAAGKSGRLANEQGYEGFGLEPGEDYDNFQPRVGMVYNIGGDGRDIARAGYGMYHDFGYTEQSILWAAGDARGRFGPVFDVINSSGIRNPDGSFFQVGQPIGNIAHLNEVNPNLLPLRGDVVTPRVKTPYTHQFSAGWSHLLADSTAIDVDYIHVEGRDLGWRARINQRDPGVGPTGPRHLADLGITPPNFRVTITHGESRYQALNLGIRRRLRAGVDLTGWYTLSQSKSTTGRAADEPAANVVVNHLDPFGDIQSGPTNTDARHRGSITAIVQLPWRVQVSPIFRFRSAEALAQTEGIDLNQDGVLTDIPAKAYAFDGFDDTGRVKVKEIGDCRHINCGRGAPFSQMNLRVSKSFDLGGSLRGELIGEVFNLFNVINPSGLIAARQLGTITNPRSNPNFMNPTRYAGDFRGHDQRVGQLGIRLTF